MTRSPLKAGPIPRAGFCILWAEHSVWLMVSARRMVTKWHWTGPWRMTWVVAVRPGELGAFQGEASTWTRTQVGAGIGKGEQNVDCNLVLYKRPRRTYGRQHALNTLAQHCPLWLQVRITWSALKTYPSWPHLSSTETGEYWGTGLRMTDLGLIGKLYRMWWRSHTRSSLLL